MTKLKVSDIDKALHDLWNAPFVPDVMWVSYDFAKEQGLDMTGIPEGSCIQVNKGGIISVVEDEESEWPNE